MPLHLSSATPFVTVRAGGHDTNHDGQCRACQTCYAAIRPDVYFPETDRSDVCCACGDLTFVARVTRAEANGHAATMFAPGDRPHDARAIETADYPARGVASRAYTFGGGRQR